MKQLINQTTKHNYWARVGGKTIFPTISVILQLKKRKTKNHRLPYEALNKIPRTRVTFYTRGYCTT